MTCDMWAEAQERWERGDGGRIDDAQESPEEDGDDHDGDHDHECGDGDVIEKVKPISGTLLQ